MLYKLLLIFVLVPLIELWLLIEIGSVIGGWLTVLLVAATGFLGLLLARSQGLHILYKMHEDIQRGIIPAYQMLSGVGILIGGAFLLTPGFITDISGFALLLPFTRNLIITAVRKIIERSLKKGTIRIYRRW